MEISQKLSILRAVKKFSFNQQFINEEEFTKIFKVIIHGLGFKETLFKGLTRTKYTSVIEKEEIKQASKQNKTKLAMNLDKKFTKKLKT